MNPTAVSSGTSSEQSEGAADEVIARDDLVEEVSIDGMCGVY